MVHLSAAVPLQHVLQCSEQRMSSVHPYKICCFPCRPLTKEPAGPEHDDTLTGILQAAVAHRRLHAYPALKRVLGPPASVSKHCKRMPLVSEQEAEDSEQASTIYRVAMQTRGILDRQMMEAAVAETAAVYFTLEAPSGQAQQAAVHELQEAPAARSVRTADEAGAASSLATGGANPAMVTH